MMSSDPIFDKKHDRRPSYEIRLKGHLDNRWVERFEGLTITLEDNGNTLLSCPGADQATLHGILKKVRDWGLILISVNPIGPGNKEVPKK